MVLLTLLVVTFKFIEFFSPVFSERNCCLNMFKTADTAMLKVVGLKFKGFCNAKLWI